ncbi:MAG: Acyl-CoA dehydrogenase [Myxococcota bacterium]|nr:Acyl-CoA dehydrogenase [Myxococcota bacterium]
MSQNAPFDFSEEEVMIQQAVRKWALEKLAPKVRDLDAERILPYPLMKDFVQTFGLDAMARAFIESMPDTPLEPGKKTRRGGNRDQAVFGAFMGLELSRWSPAFAMAFGVSLGLAGGGVMSRGTPRQIRRWALPLLTFEKVGSWALTEPGAGSDAFGSMKTTARKSGGGYILKGQKTFITNAPHADIFLLYARVTQGAGEEGFVQPFVLERGMKGLTTGPAMRKMGMHASPTGEIFLDDVEVSTEHLLGESETSTGRDHVKEGFYGERAGVVGPCLGIIEQCLEQSLKYARERSQFGRKIAEYQLIQEKIARMYVARENVRNIFLKHLNNLRNGQVNSLAEASAWKLYCAQTATGVAMEAIQLHGGYGYMADFHVEMLARDAKLFQIGGGTDEIQTTTIARNLLENGLSL